MIASGERFEISEAEVEMPRSVKKLRVIHNTAEGAKSQRVNTVSGCSNPHNNDLNVKWVTSC